MGILIGTIVIQLLYMAAKLEHFSIELWLILYNCALRIDFKGEV